MGFNVGEEGWRAIKDIALAGIAAAVTIATAYIAARWRITTRNQGNNKPADIKPGNDNSVSDSEVKK